MPLSDDWHELSELKWGLISRKNAWVCLNTDRGSLLLKLQLCWKDGHEQLASADSDWKHPKTSRTAWCCGTAADLVVFDHCWLWDCESTTNSWERRALIRWEWSSIDDWRLTWTLTLNLNGSSWWSELHRDFVSQSSLTPLLWCSTWWALWALSPPVDLRYPWCWGWPDWTRWESAADSRADWWLEHLMRREALEASEYWLCTPDELMPALRLSWLMLLREMKLWQLTACYTFSLLTSHLRWLQRTKWLS